MSNSFPLSLNRPLKRLILILATLGFPAASIAIFTSFVKVHLLISIIIFIFYEIGVFLLGFLGKIWQKIEPLWTARIADWVDQWTLLIFSHYNRQYCKYLGYQHRDFDVKGLTLQGTYTMELDQVFIELSIDPTTLQQMSANPLQIPKKFSEEKNSIWDYLASIELSRQHIVITGPPGSGKTTLLKHITLLLLTHGKRRRKYKTRIPRKLPILLTLRDHKNAIHIGQKKDESKYTLVDALHDHLKRWQQKEPPAGWVKEQLHKGRCLVMLDGLDEVADPIIRKEVANWTERQMIAYPQNRFIITSRPFGLRSNPLKNVVVLEVRPFVYEQVRKFINKWYLSDEVMRKQKHDPGVEMRAKAEAQELMQQLSDTPVLLDLTVNPLLLTMIVIVHRYGGGGKLPQKRALLYEDICKVFLGKRHEARGQHLELKYDQIQLVLQPLAYYMMVKGIREIATEEATPIIQEALDSVSTNIFPEEFLKLVENISGLLLERENGVYAFAHKTFQEYLAAKYIHEEKLGHKLVALVENIWWQETIKLYCSMSDATPIINACLANDYPSISALVLAFDCQKDARELKTSVQARLKDILQQGLKDSDPERQHIVTQVLLAQRLNHMIPIKENLFIDTSLITNAEYQLFIDEKKAQGKYYQPDHWENYRFLPGQGNFPVTGIRYSDATEFCKWLTERESKPWYFRLPKKNELTENILKKISANYGYWSDNNQKFNWIKDPLLLPETLQKQALDNFLLILKFSINDKVFERANSLVNAHENKLDIDNHLNKITSHREFLDKALDPFYFFNRIITTAHENEKNIDNFIRNFFNRANDQRFNYDINQVLHQICELTLIFWRSYNRSHPREKYTHYQKLGDEYFALYLSIIILEARIKRKLPAHEALFIVKEQKIED